MIRAALIAAGVPEDAIILAESESASIETALEMARPTDLVLIFCDAITRSWKQIIYFRPKEAAAPGRRRSGWSPPPASTCPRATASSATSAASASCRSD